MEVAENAGCAGPPQPQRRECPRYAVEGDATVLLVRQGLSLACGIADLGLGGCRIHTRDRLPVGTGIRVEIGFKINGVAFRFVGVTRWTDGRHVAGIQFLEMSARRREELEEVIGEVETAARRAQEKAKEQKAADGAGEPEGQGATKPIPAPPAKQPPTARPSAKVAEWPVTRLRPESVPARLSSMPPAASKLQTTAGANAAASAHIAAASAQADPAAVTDPLAAQTGALAARAPQSRPAPVKQERRSQARRPVDTTATIFLVRGGAKLTGRILDLSLNGCRIRTDERFPVGIYTRVETEFRLEGLPFRLGGVIQAIHGPFAVGVRFLDMSERKKEQVAELIQEIDEMHAPRDATTNVAGGAPGAGKPEM